MQGLGKYGRPKSMQGLRLFKTLESIQSKRIGMAEGQFERTKNNM
jgi:hypothetical protein